jgi:hypothetical protein
MNRIPTITRHAAEKAQALGLTEEAVKAVMTGWTGQSPSRIEGQRRYVRGDVCVVVDEARFVAITLYRNVEETALRPDQKAKGVRKGAGVGQ